MSIKRKMAASVVACALLLAACDYIVLPDEDGPSTSTESRGWSAVVTNVGQSESGNLHIDIAIRNETADWSAMQAAPGKPAVLSTGDGQTTNCGTVFVGTGGHRLAPGFQMRGYIAGTKAEPETQLIFVECAGADLAAGSTLSIDYAYVIGEYNYYEQDANRDEGTLNLDLGQVPADLIYPIAEEVDGLIQAAATEIAAINGVVLNLAGVERNDQVLQLTWQTSNPGSYASYVHVGTPPVIGNDGILYGFYVSPDIVSVPVTPAGGTAEWSTEITVPPEVTGLYVMLGVESKKQRLFSYYVVDIADV